MIKTCVALIFAFAVALPITAPDAAYGASRKPATASQPKPAKKKPAAHQPAPKKNNFGGAVLNCRPPMTYADWSRCGYGL
jgi:hypothetical protein